MRIRISKQNEETIDRIKSLYKFNSEGIVPRIAFAYSLQTNVRFDLNLDLVPGSDGRDFRDDRGLFGTIIEGRTNYPIFKAVLEQHYQKTFSEEDFTKELGRNNIYNIVCLYFLKSYFCKYGIILAKVTSRAI